jgi:hypothetical protein
MGTLVRRYLGYGYGLLRGMCRTDPQYSAASVREAKCTRLGYGTRLSRLHTLDPLISISFFGEQSFSYSRPRVRK